jgi:mRNA interferase MazF
MHPRRGEVWWVSFDSAIGGEIQKTRPAIVVSNNAANAVLNRVIVVPVTSRADRVYPGEALIEINGQQSKAMSDQITTVSKVRLRNKIDLLSNTDLNLIENYFVSAGYSPLIVHSDDQSIH